MILESIKLQNFRSFSNKEFHFSAGTTLIIGPNASGKTNLLEAICLLGRGKSFRAQLESEMIGYGKEMSNVKCQMSNGEKLEIVLTIGEVMGKRVAKKIYRINGVNKRMMDFVGNLRVVYFGPEDLEIVVNSPAIRRDWLDSVLAQIDRDYCRASLSYSKGLRQRNKLLEKIRDEGKPPGALFFWNKLLVENGQVISQKREEFVEFINQQPDYFGRLFLDYNKSIISPQRLEKYAQQEIAAGMTLVGPHRDDIKFKIKNEKLTHKPVRQWRTVQGYPVPNLSSGTRVKMERDLSLFGSRGEQRTAVFCLKLSELEFMAEKTNERPVLLLDDIFSELDHQRREHLLEVIPKQQTIITTTDIHLVKRNYLGKMKVIELR